MKLILLSIIIIFSITVLFGQTGRPKPDDSKKILEDMKPDPEIVKIFEEVKARTKKEILERSPKGWLIYGEPNNALLLYNSPTVVKKGKLAKVWSKNFDLWNESYELSLMEINCEEHEYKVLNIMEYNKEHKLIKSIRTDPSLTPNPIIPDSVTQALEIKVCKVIK